MSDAGSGEWPHFVLDRKADQEALWLMPGKYLWFGFRRHQELIRQISDSSHGLNLESDHMSMFDARHQLMKRS